MSPFNPGTGGLVGRWEVVGNWWIEKGSKND